MIGMSARAVEAALLTRRTTLRVGSTLAGTALHSDIPVADGTETVDASLAVPERVTLRVPRVVDGVSWDPSGVADHPLAPWGQRITVDIGVDVGLDAPEWVRRGEYLIWETEVDGDEVTVTALGLMSVLDVDLDIAVTSAPRCAETLARLVAGALPVQVTSAGLPDPMITARSWDGGRLDAVMDVIDVWGVSAVVTPGGVMEISPDTDPTVVDIALTDGVGGTVAAVTGSTSRDGVCSMVVARGTTATGAPTRGVAWDTDPRSPLRWGGPLSPLPVPHIHESSLLTTDSACRAAAARVLREIRRRPERSVSVEMVPHPGVERGDLVEVAAGSGVVRGVVDALSLPLVASGGPEVLTLREVAP